MKTVYATAEEAIARSSSHDEIAYCEDSEENRAILMAESDDWTDSNEGYEYWADADDSNGIDGKMEWRVHIRTATAE